MGDAPVALVQGHAAVRDSDLQANTDRYVRSSQEKLPDATKGQPKFVLKQMKFYYARIWIEITPLRILWWSDRSTSRPPDEWRAPDGTLRPESDPAPPGSVPPPWRQPPTDWRHVAERALSVLPLADLTTVDDDGVPQCIPVGAGAALEGDTVVLQVGAGAPTLRAGPACLTVHGHAERFTGQENHTFVGTLEVGGAAPAVRSRAGIGRLEPGGQPSEHGRVLSERPPDPESPAQSRGSQARPAGPEGSFRLSPGQ